MVDAVKLIANIVNDVMTESESANRVMKPRSCWDKGVVREEGRPTHFPEGCIHRDFIDPKNWTGFHLFQVFHIKEQSQKVLRMLIYKLLAVLMVGLFFSLR